jgi:competence protein ComGF
MKDKKIRGYLLLESLVSLMVAVVVISGFLFFFQNFSKDDNKFLKEDYSYEEFSARFRRMLEESKEITISKDGKSLYLTHLEETKKTDYRWEKIVLSCETHEGMSERIDLNGVSKYPNIYSYVVKDMHAKKEDKRIHFEFKLKDKTKKDFYYKPVENV